MLSLIFGEEVTYLGFDSPYSRNSDVVDDVHTREFSNTVNIIGIYKLYDKVKSWFFLLRF
jgi:hypothetical protein